MSVLSVKMFIYQCTYFARNLPTLNISKILRRTAARVDDGGEKEPRQDEEEADDDPVPGRGRKREEEGKAKCSFPGGKT